MLIPATAGREGADVRSDCLVRITPTDAGGLDLTVNSKVESMYGAAIRRQCREVLAELGVINVQVVVNDAGAPPFALAARLETAAWRAGLTDKQAIPAAKPYARYTLSRDRFRRSRLYLPGNDPKYMLNAGVHHPDGVILDLEDSVAPPEKDAARALVRNALQQVNFYGAERMVRINQGPRGLEDLDWVIPCQPHVILIPKVEDPAQVTAVEQHICELCNKHAIAPEIYLMPIVESALGGFRALEIAKASKYNIGLAVGLEDYTADIGVVKTLEGRESFWLRSVIVNAARAAGIQPIDTVFSDVSDMEGLRASVKEARALGFDGKGCIHPRQIAVIHEAFAPEPAEIDKARKIALAFDRAEREGLGVVSVGSKMVDPPVVKRALRTITMAESLGLLDKNWREAR